MSDSDDSDMDWEQIVPNEPTIETPGASSSNTPLEITIKAPARARDQSELKKEKAQADALKRVIRLGSHRLHTLALLANASIRNKWLNDDLLKARLLSLTPLPIHTSFAMINKRNQPNKDMRGRQFEAALARLAEWWISKFIVEHEKGISRQSFESAARMQLPPSLFEDKPKKDKKGKGKAKLVDADDNDDPEGERIRSVNSMMKHALMMRGSPDMSAQLFTSLCRALGLPSRLVVSLQPVLWRREKSDKERAVDRAIQKSRKAQKDRASLAREAALVSATARNASGKTRTPTVTTTNEGTSRQSQGRNGSSVPPPSPLASATEGGHPSPSPSSVHLRKSRPIGRTLNDKRGVPKPRQKKEDSPPIFWTEVYSRPDKRWFPVNPITGTVDRRTTFEPASTDKFNHMMYVVAFEEDGYIRDVTPRYTKNFVTKVLRERTSSSRPDWWDAVVLSLVRPYRLHRDDVEDAEFEALQMIEGMPTSVGAFKNHPLYALERHLHQDEVIHPRTQIGNFRGEPVFPRHSVISLKSAENWLRSSGRVVKEGAQAMKMGKVRAATLNKKRAVEMAAIENERSGERGGEGVMQGLYAEWQTEPFVPDPVVDGKVPKNDFGNIDLYTPSMLPAGGVHVPFKGCAKIARQLGIDYAEAVTGFEFKQRRAFPIIKGVVIPIERQFELVEAYEASALAAEEKEKKKKEERVIKLWTKIIHGLRIRERLKSQYKKEGGDGGEGVEKGGVVVAIAESDEEGGFVKDGDESHDAQQGLESLTSHITRYELPKLVLGAQGRLRIQDPLADATNPNKKFGEDDGDGDDNGDEFEEIVPYSRRVLEEDDLTPETPQPRKVLNTGGGGAPKTMSEFAATMREASSSPSTASDIESMPNENEEPAPSSPTSTSTRRITRNGTRSKPPTPFPITSTPARKTKKRTRSATTTETSTPSNGRKKRRKRKSYGDDDSDDSDSDAGDEVSETEDFVAKKTRRVSRNKGGSVAVEAVKSDRVLRARGPKKSLAE